MTDGAPPHDASVGGPPPPPQAEPPSLDAIRVKGPGARGLNKPAILIATASGVAIVLALASGAFSGDPARKPAENKPMMSDPARPEVARGAVRQLPADYTQVAPPSPRLAEAVDPPVLGPPLPGDIAAFAGSQPALRSYSSGGDQDWSNARPPPGSPAAPDPALIESVQAERSGLFFDLRQKAGLSPKDAPATSPSVQPLLTAFAPQAPAGAPTSAAERALFPGAIIPASLVTGINSESPGPVIAQVTQAVYDSATGRTLLIPQGARLIGDYKSSAGYGQSRIAIVWQYLIMPDGREVKIGERATDPAGAAGLSGEVDNHWGEVFGAAALGTLINVGLASTEDQQLSLGGIGIVTRDPVDTAIVDGVQRTASTVSNRVVDRDLAIPPTIRVPAGAKLSVIVTRRTGL